MKKATNFESVVMQILSCGTARNAVYLAPVPSRSHYGSFVCVHRAVVCYLKYLY